MKTVARRIVAVQLTQKFGSTRFLISLLLEGLLPAYLPNWAALLNWTHLNEIILHSSPTPVITCHGIDVTSVLSRFPWATTISHFLAKLHTAPVTRSAQQSWLFWFQLGQSLLLPCYSAAGEILRMSSGKDVCLHIYFTYKEAQISLLFYTHLIQSDFWYHWKTVVAQSIVSPQPSRWTVDLCKPGTEVCYLHGPGNLRDMQVSHGQEHNTLHWLGRKNRFAIHVFQAIIAFDRHETICYRSVKKQAMLFASLNPAFCHVIWLVLTPEIWPFPYIVIHHKDVW